MLLSSPILSPCTSGIPSLSSTLSALHVTGLPVCGLLEPLRSASHSSPLPFISCPTHWTVSLLLLYLTFRFILFSSSSLYISLSALDSFLPVAIHRDRIMDSGLHSSHSASSSSRVSRTQGTAVSVFRRPCRETRGRDGLVFLHDHAERGVANLFLIGLRPGHGKQRSLG